jgi:serine/threonine protein kinase
MSGLEIVAFAMGAVGFVKTVLDIWDNIDKKRQEHKESDVLAKQLKLFGLAERREELKIALELAQTIVRDRTRSKNEVLGLVASFQRLNELLEAIPGAVDTAVKLASGKLYLLHRGTAFRECKSKVASLDEKISSFHQKVMGLRAIVQTDSSLLLSHQDFSFVGAKPEFVQIGETSFTNKASYIAPGQDGMTIQEVVLEKRHYGNQPKEAVLKSARILSTKLSPALPAWNILHLIGYRDDETDKSVQLIFYHPGPDKELKSLSRMYTDRNPEPTLNIRVRLCSQLAVAVLQTHKLGLVHKHIRPGNLLVNFERASNGDIQEASLFLAGWQNARLIEGVATTLIGETTVSKIIYQHPKRRVEDNRAKESYDIDHDIYSLGVCMLELLTWDTLIRQTEDELADEVMSDAYRHTFESLGFHQSFPSVADDEEDGGPSEAELYTYNAEHTKKTLEVMAQSLVARKAGESMASLVYRCISGVFQPRNDQTQTEEKDQVAEQFANDVFDDFNKLLSVL